MYKRTIIVHKERIVVPHLAVVPVKIDNKRMSKKDFEEFLKQCPLKEGALVTLYKETSEAFALHNFNLVAYVETNYDKLHWDDYSNSPKCYRMVSLADDAWVRFDTAHGYRFPTEKEIDKLIRPNHAKIQNYRQQYTGHHAPSPV